MRRYCVSEFSDPVLFDAHSPHKTFAGRSGGALQLSHSRRSSILQHLEEAKDCNADEAAVHARWANGGFVAVVDTDGGRNGWSGHRWFAPKQRPEFVPGVAAREIG